jgi:hypothetical protein
VQMRVWTTEATELLGQAEAIQLLGQTPFRAPDIRAPSLPEQRCQPDRGPRGGGGCAGAPRGAISGPGSLIDKSV